MVVEDFAFRQARIRGPTRSAWLRTILVPRPALLGDYWRMDVCDFIQVTVCMTRIQRLFWRAGRPKNALRRAKQRAGLLDPEKKMSPVPGEQHSFRPRASVKMLSAARAGRSTVAASTRLKNLLLPCRQQ